VNHQMKDILDRYQALGALDLSSLTPEEARQMPELRDVVHHAPEKVAKAEHRVIGDGVTLRIYTPHGEGPFPILVYYHGGGWVIASLNTYDASCRGIVNRADCIVVSVAYRQAPEHPYPAARNDAFDAYRWVLARARSLNGDPDRIAVGGESAGGNLAAVVCLMARDQGIRQPLHQLLVYPITQFGFDTASYHEQANAKPLNRPMMQWFWRQYLPQGAHPNDPYHSPLRARSLRDLAPATIIGAELDPLRTEGAMYADALREAGVPVTYQCYKGVAHEFFGFARDIRRAEEAMSEACDQLRMAFEARLYARELIHPTQFTYGRGMSPDRSPGY
jgi:acetyl esterase